MARSDRSHRRQRRDRCPLPPSPVPSQSGAHLGRIALGAVAVAAAIAIVLAMIVAAPKAAQTTSAAGAAQPTWDHGSSSDVSTCRS